MNEERKELLKDQLRSIAGEVNESNLTYMVSALAEIMQDVVELIP